MRSVKVTYENHNKQSEQRKRKISEWVRESAKKERNCVYCRRNNSLFTNEMNGVYNNSNEEKGKAISGFAHIHKNEKEGVYDDATQN